MSSAGQIPQDATQAPPPVGLINTAPGSTTTTPGTPPAGAPPSGAPVTGYNPASATATNANSTGYNANAFTVTPDQTVAGQIKNIIASGSPLMQQAEANAKSQMNSRGLINSSQAITAGQSALYTAATPIATADAATNAAAATNTTQAKNTEAAAEAAAANTAGLQNSQLGTQTSQFNAGQTNASLSLSATASNAVAQQAQTIAGSKDIASLQANTQTAIAAIQADTTLSVADKQAASSQIIAQANNQNQVLLQQMSNASSMANIQANGTINTQIQKLTDDNKTLLQTSTSAAQVYSQALANLSAITTNNNLSESQKVTALNDGVQQLNDALSVLSQIAQMPELQSALTFNS